MKVIIIVIVLLLSLSSYSQMDSGWPTVNSANHQNPADFGNNVEELTNAKIHVIWEELPEDIRGLAIHWGTSDTVFRDKLYEHLKNNK
jgi:hypothetical protein